MSASAMQGCHNYDYHIYACLKLSGVWIPHSEVGKSRMNVSMMFGNSSHDPSHYHATNALHQTLQQCNDNMEFQGCNWTQ